MNPWFALTDLVRSGLLPRQGFAALIAHDPYAVALPAAYYGVPLSAVQARELLTAYSKNPGSMQPSLLIAAVSRALSPEELAAELRRIDAGWKLIAAAMVFLGRGAALHYLTRHGTKSVAIAQQAYLGGHTMPASNVRQALANGVPHSGFLAVSCPDLAPVERARALFGDLDVQFANSEINRLAMADALRDPEVAAAAADLLDEAEYIWALRDVVLTVPAPQSSEAVSSMAKTLIDESGILSFQEFSGVVTNYGLTREVRDLARQFAVTTPDNGVKNPEWRAVPDEAVDYLGDMVRSHRQVKVEADFSTYAVAVGEASWAFDKRWPSFHRQVVRLVDMLMDSRMHNLKAAKAVRLVRTGDLVPLFAEARLAPLSALALGCYQPQDLQEVMVRLAGRAVTLDVDESWGAMDLTLRDNTHELIKEVVDAIGSDSQAWETFLGLYSNGITPMEAAAIAV